MYTGDYLSNSLRDLWGFKTFNPLSVQMREVSQEKFKKSKSAHVKVLCCPHEFQLESVKQICHEKAVNSLCLNSQM